MLPHAAVTSVPGKERMFPLPPLLSQSFAAWFVKQAVVPPVRMYPGIQGFALYFPGLIRQSLSAEKKLFQSLKVFFMAAWFTCAGSLL